MNAQDAPQLLSQQLEAAKRARGWIDGEMLVNDWVAVVSYDTHLKVQQDFTHDRQALIAAVGDAMKGKEREGNYPSRIDPSKGPSLLAGLPRGDELSNKTPKIYDALQQLARSAGNIRGRKNLMLFTYGLPSYNTTPFGQFVPDKRYFLPTVNALNANNVAIYSIDLTPPAVEHRLSDALNKMSDDTGGRYFYNVTNFSTPLSEIGKENSGYYLLSYQSEQPAGKTGFQNVTVTTTNPEFRVKARKGYETGNRPSEPSTGWRAPPRRGRIRKNGKEPSFPPPLEQPPPQSRIGLPAGEEIAQDPADAGVDSRHGDHPARDRRLEEEIARTVGPFHLPPQLARQSLRVGLRAAREQALCRPEPGEHPVADPLAGERVRQRRRVAHQQHAALQAPAHPLQGPGTEDRDGIAVARPGEVPPAGRQVTVEEGVERGAGGAFREPPRV